MIEKELLTSWFSAENLQRDKIEQFLKENNYRMMIFDCKNTTERGDWQWSAIVALFPKENILNGAQVINKYGWETLIDCVKEELDSEILEDFMENQEYLQERYSCTLFYIDTEKKILQNISHTQAEVICEIPRQAINHIFKMNFYDHSGEYSEEGLYEIVV